MSRVAVPEAAGKLRVLDQVRRQAVVSDHDRVAAGPDIRDAVRLACDVAACWRSQVSSTSFAAEARHVMAGNETL